MLYNESEVQLGKQNRDLYRRLREDLERSQAMYSQRVSDDVTKGTDYFQEEVVRTLADGDPALLGRS